MTEISEREKQTPGPTEFGGHLVYAEATKAAIWLGIALGIGLVIILIHPILLIIAATVVAAMLDGGVRLLERVLPIKRIWRLTILCLAILAFLGWMMFYAGSQLASQALRLKDVVTAQLDKIISWAGTHGVEKYTADTKTIIENLAGAFSHVTEAVGFVFGGFFGGVMILILGVYIAIEPRLYERGVAWMLPMNARSHYHQTMAAVGRALRRLMAGRLLAMTIEGFATWLLLLAGGVPMAALLGLLTGLFAFIPNIGALISGSLLILAGFSVSVEVGLYAVGVYLVVHAIDGYIIVPMVAKRAVDMPPALVLGAQILMGTLFGILGLALADPIVAMIKVWLEEEAARKAHLATEREENTRSKQAQKM